jgi:hypothetical protein
MRKIIATLALVCVVAGGVFGQTGLLDVNKYFSYFPIKTNEKVSDNDYVWASDEGSYARFAMINGEDDLIDNPLEFALLSYYSPAVLKIRPKESDAILPANNPKLADQKLGAAVFQEIQVLRFLGNTASAGRHEAVLQFITDRKNVTRAEIETYYRSNIRKLVSDIVDAEVAKRQPTNPTTIAELKQIMTGFFLNPTLENHNVLYEKQRHYSATDGDRGRNASRVLVVSIAGFNSELGETVINPSRLAPK